MVAALHRCAELVEGPLTSAAYHRLHDQAEPGARTIGARFGSWSAALEAASLPPTGFLGRPRPPRRRWTRADALSAVARWAATAEDTRLPAYAVACSVDPDLPPPDHLAGMFGGWRRTLAVLNDPDRR